MGTQSRQAESTIGWDSPAMRKLEAEYESIWKASSEEERGQFANELLAFMVKSFVDMGDRDSLITLLSTRCSGRIFWIETIEFYLAYRGREMGDPILILGEAYSKCDVDEVRRDIAAAIRRGFAGLGFQEEDDADFVANAMQWYKQERENTWSSTGTSEKNEHPEITGPPPNNPPFKTGEASHPVDSDLVFA